MIFKNIPLIIILVIATILRFYQLGQNPPSLNWDEVSNGYNAYSILKTARDEYGNFLPLTFRSFGDYNPALSVYTIVPSIAIFGLNEFAVRFPSAFLGTLTVLLTYLMVEKLFRNWSITPEASSASTKHNPGVSLAKLNELHGSTALGLLSAFFLAISPWHLQFSRYDHEANFMVFFAIWALTLLIYSFKNQKLLIPAAVSFGLALNTYHGAKIWIPLFILVTAVFFAKQLLSLRKKVVLPLIILLISTYPIFTNLEKATIRSSSVGIFNQHYPLKTFRENYLSHFSLNFIFVSGDTIKRHSVPGMGQLYVAELPLILLGLLMLIKQSSQSNKFLLAWLLIAPIPASLATPAPHALRAITFMPVWHIISAIGLYTLLNSKITKSFKFLATGVILSVLTYNLVTYLHLYYKHYPKLSAIEWQNGYKEMINFIYPIKDNYSTIAISNYYGHPYIFTLFYTKFDPEAYQKLEDKSKFANFEFFGESWEKQKKGLALVVRPTWQKPIPAPRYIKEIRDVRGEVVFRISEEE